MDEMYTAFAQVYDLFMEETPYPAWRDFILEVLRRYQVPEGSLVADLCCGTGALTQLLAEAGYDMIGIDASISMLMQAQQKAASKGSSILYLNQPAQELNLYGTVGAVTCCCDSLNYILSQEDLLEIFRRVNNFLDPDGIFIFDLNTRYKYETLIGDATIAETREKASFIWENTFVPEENLNEYLLTLFVEQEEGLFRREIEHHVQRAYALDEILDLLRQAGLVLLEICDNYTPSLPHPQSERVTVIAKEKGKGKTGGVIP